MPSRLRNYVQRLIRGIIQIGPFVAFAAFLIAVTLRMTVKDTYLVTAIFYYATPPIVLIALPFFAGVLFTLRQRRFLALTAILASAAVTPWCLSAVFSNNTSDDQPSTISALLWNVRRNVQKRPGIIDGINQSNADIVALSEAFRASDQHEVTRHLRTHFPDYEQSEARSGMVVLCRGTVENTQFHRLPPAGTCLIVDVRTRDIPVRIVVVDLSSKPYLPREPTLENLHNLLANLNPKADLVMGDFNTPLDSLHFERLRLDFQHAFSVKGNGLRNTWPIPFPILEIDHLWVAKDWRVAYASLGWSYASDHRSVSAGIFRP
ncbi:endonuclease/exonuclease/phosphatase family protein [bacterium AH-315-F18]|nr:endonuclease/exonuclease/phosphatase family protein [bacterium AH-315-F18]